MHYAPHNIYSQCDVQNNPLDYIIIETVTASKSRRGRSSFKQVPHFPWHIFRGVLYILVCVFKRIHDWPARYKGDKNTNNAHICEIHVDDWVTEQWHRSVNHIRLEQGRTCIVQRSLETRAPRAAPLPASLPSASLDLAPSIEFASETVLRLLHSPSLTCREQEMDECIEGSRSA